MLMETNWGSWGSESRRCNYVNTPVKYVIVESGNVKYVAKTWNSGVRIDVATMFLSQRRLDRQNKCLAVDKPQIPQCDYDLVRVRHSYHSVRAREGSCFDLSWKLLWGLPGSIPWFRPFTNVETQSGSAVAGFPVWLSRFNSTSIPLQVLIMKVSYGKCQYCSHVWHNYCRLGTIFSPYVSPTGKLFL